MICPTCRHNDPPCWSATKWGALKPCIVGVTQELFASWSVTQALGRMIEGNMPRYFFHLRLPSVD